MLSSLSVLVSLAAHRSSTDTAQAVENERVEIGVAGTNSNEPNYSNGWEPWEAPVSPATVYLGVQRMVLFKKRFSTIPRVSTALSIIDTKSVGQILKDLGYRLPNDASRLEEINLVAWPSGVTEEGFTLQVGVGVPTAPGVFLLKKLQTSQPQDEFVAEMLRFHQLSDRSGLGLTDNERWMTNFYKYVGSLDISWVAQGR